MKFRQKYLHWAVPAAITLLAVVALVAWTGHPQTPGTVADKHQDTLPSKRSKVTREQGDKDLDKELRELDRAKDKLNNQD